MPNLWACWILFNEVQFAQRSFRNTLPWVDKAIIIDGPFKTFPHETNRSTDGTLDLARKACEEFHKDAIIIEGKEYECEVDKRNVYLEKVPVGDWMLLVDADEQPSFTEEAYARLRQGMNDPTLTGFTIKLLAHATKTVPIVYDWGNPRIFRNVGGLKYKYNHYSIFDSQGRMFYFEPYRFEKLNIMFVHWTEEREATSIFQKMQYHKQKRREQSSGFDTFFCATCKESFKLPQGTLIHCPKCEGENVGADVEVRGIWQGYDKPAIPMEKFLKDHAQAAQRNA